VLEIERHGWLSSRYVVRDDRGHTGTWVRRHFTEAMSGDVDGRPYEFARRGRQHFVLLESGNAIATAAAAKRGRWLISADGAVYELCRKSAWRSERQLLRDGSVVGSIRRARPKVLADLPADLAPIVQAFVGLVVVTLWQRDATNAGVAGSVAATGQ
jgi:hypothetical protein